jgi:hypothetical protein
VNTRSFYWIGLGQEAPEDPNDAMGLVPFADYFNHADVAVRFSQALELCFVPWADIVLRTARCEIR